RPETGSPDSSGASPRAGLLPAEQWIPPDRTNPELTAAATSVAAAVSRRLAAGPRGPAGALPGTLEERRLQAEPCVAHHEDADVARLYTQTAAMIRQPTDTLATAGVRYRGDTLPRTGGSVRWLAIP